MGIVIPDNLSKGDKVVVVSPAGRATQTKIDAVANGLKEMGLEVVIDPQNYLVDDDSPYHPGTAQQRADALNNAFADASVKAIFCVRGGEGALDLLHRLDYELIKSNPKILVGISDITILQSAILRKTGLVTYHGPVFIHFMEEKEYAQKNLQKVLFDKAQEIDLDIEKVLVDKKSAEGVLVGGNLTALSLISDDFWYTDENIILMMEDLNEYRFRMNRCIAFLEAAGRFKNLKGVIIGRNMYNDDDDFGIDFDKIALNRFVEKDIPVVSGAAFGHLGCQGTYPIGMQVELLIENDSAKLKLK